MIENDAAPAASSKQIPMAHAQRCRTQMHELPQLELFSLIVQSPKCTRAINRVGFYDNAMDLGVAKQRARRSSICAIAADFRFA